MNNEKKKTTTSKDTKKPAMLNGKQLQEYVTICVKNKISQLNLPDGTVIQMSPLAYYDENKMNFAPSQSEIPTTKGDDFDTIDEDILFASARS